jgi:parallel beta-helix repeat protein
MTPERNGSTDRRALLAGIGGLAAGTFLSAGRAEAGPLSPPAAPASTPGPEPRIAVNSTNTPGDATSVFRIIEPGSYYLTSNVIGQAGKHGILISAPEVMLDLNGFSLSGVGNALSAILGTASQICVRNGQVSSWPGGGISLAVSAGSLVSGISVRTCGGVGIRIGTAGLVDHCTVSGGSNHGIETSFGSNVRGCSSAENLGVGILATTSCMVVDCVASACVSGGILVGGESMVSNCVATFNVDFGIRGQGTGGVISGNTASSNVAGQGLGIDGAGIAFRIDSNHLVGNKTGIFVTGSNNQIIRNTASSNLVQAYIIGVSNAVGPIDIADTASSPWANLE